MKQRAKDSTTRVRTRGLAKADGLSAENSPMDKNKIGTPMAQNTKSGKVVIRMKSVYIDVPMKSYDGCSTVANETLHRNPVFVSKPHYRRAARCYGKIVTKFLRSL